MPIIDENRLVPIGREQQQEIIGAPRLASARREQQQRNVIDESRLVPVGQEQPIISMQDITNLTSPGVRVSPTGPEPRRIISEFARPTLEFGGLTAGAVAGELAQPLGGGVIGGGLGFAGGSELADKLDEFFGLIETDPVVQKFKKIPKRIVTGAAIQAGGEAILPATAGGFKILSKIAEKTGVTSAINKLKSLFPKDSPQEILKKAKGMIDDLRAPETEAIKKTKQQMTQESQDVLTRLGVSERPTFAQMSGAQKAAAFEQSAASQDKALASMLKQKDATIAEQGLAGVERQFPGKADISDVITAFEKEKIRLTESANIALEKAGVSEGVVLSAKDTQQSTGRALLDFLESSKGVEKNIVKQEFDKIPSSVLLNPARTSDAVSRIIADRRKIGGGRGSFPGFIVAQIKKATKPSKDGTIPQITFEKLRDWRSQISQEISDNSIGQVKPSQRKLVRRLEILKTGIDDTLDEMSNLGGTNAKAAEQYTKAKGVFIQFAKRFRQGTVGDVLQIGRKSTGKKLTFSQVPRSFFQPGNIDVADDLINAIGQEKASVAMRDFALHDLASAAGTGSGEIATKKATTWLFKNKALLNKFGLTDEFKGIIDTKQVADRTLATLSAFEKSSASKILNNDVDKIMADLFTGKASKQTAQQMTKLLNTSGIKGNSKAIKGIQNSFKDFLLGNIQKTQQDLLRNPLKNMAQFEKLIKKFEPALRVLYKNEPQKVQAFFDYQKLLTMLSRNKNVTFAQGSTTAEKIAGIQREISGEIIRGVTQVAAIQRGSGFLISSIRGIVNNILSGPSRIEAAQVEAIMKEAIWNPEAAEIVMSAAGKAKKPFSPKDVEKLLIKMGLFEVFRDEEPRQRAQFQETGSAL